VEGRSVRERFNGSRVGARSLVEVQGSVTSNLKCPSDPPLDQQSSISNQRVDPLVLPPKYLKAAITYQGIQRIERYPVPDAALREAILNALVHRNYSVGAPVQIRVQEDRLKIWNPCVLPDGWTVKNLLGAHASTPFNPAIANVFFRSGEIETWGRGIERIFAACRDAGTPNPRLRLEPNGLWLEFPYAAEYLKAMPATGGQVIAEATAPVTAPVTEFVAKLLNLLGQQEPLGNEDVRLAFSLKSRRRLRETYLVPALAAALIERTHPDKPSSRFQKYRLTAQGRAWLAQHHR
jgi:ATP-dependent DNA helicase RecG